VRGAHLLRPRTVSSHALVFDLHGSWLWLDASSATAGIYLLGHDDVLALRGSGETEPQGPAKQMLLHVRKHLSGRRVSGFRRISGTRTLVLEVGDASLISRGRVPVSPSS
jgi:hypothetical protein